MRVEVKAVACELPWQQAVPLSRFSAQEIAREVIRRGLVAEISGTTVWRWLAQDAIRPWQYRSWIFPRDPQFAEKAGRVLDLYAGKWGHHRLRPDEYVLCADEKPSIQARIRLQASLPPAPKHSMRVEHEYRRAGALTYLAAWDVHRAKLFGRCEPRSGIDAFEGLVDQVMRQSPYCEARRVFWILDNGSAHRGQPCIQRLRKAWPRLTPVHLPIPASWLNQIEIYFSIVQRKVLTPNDFLSLQAVEERLLQFQQHYQQIALPFQWHFTRKDLNKMLAKLSDPSQLSDQQEVAA